MEQFAGFECQAEIGQGEIATVYRARNLHNEQLVALKVLRADSPVPGAWAYFENEIAVLSKLHHRRIPRLLAYGEQPQPYMAITLVEGKDGEALLDDIPADSFFPTEQLVRWGIQLCEALSHLHKRQPPIAFCDMKASHLMVDAAGDAWLVDFNLAQILSPDGFAMQSNPAGTEGFAAPEHYQGKVTPLVDVYGLGATLHYLSTRIDPREGRAFTYAPPRSVNPRLSKAFASVMMKALAYEPEERYTSISAMRTALVNCL